MKDNSGLIAIAMIVTAIVVTVIATTAIACRHTEKMAELGYQEDLLPGSSVPHWRKCR